MRKSFLLSVFEALVVATTAFFSACSDNGKEKEVLQSQIDSLTTVNQAQCSDLKDMMTFIIGIAESIDSIAKYEGMLLNNKGREGVMVDKSALKQNLEAFGTIIDQQREHIRQLELQLSQHPDTSGITMKMRTMIDAYTAQLNEKDEMIIQLRADLENKNINITQLSQRISSLNKHNEQLTAKNQEQERIMNVQDEELNTGYIQIGTKKELTNKGLLSGGLLQKKKVDGSKLKAENFMRVDIREFNDVTLQSKSPKILTQVPAGSYTIVRNSDGTSTLTITDPATFWSISNFLVIQL